MRGNGSIRQRGSVYWLRYSYRGKRFEEPGGRTEKEAANKLKQRLKEIYGNRFVGPQEERTTVGELLDSLITHLQTRGSRSASKLEGRKGTPFLSHIKPVRSAFGFERAIDLTTPRIERYQKFRLEEGKSRATVNREVGALSQAFNLAKRQGRLTQVPYFPRLKENNARQGFFDRAEFEKLKENLPSPLDDVALFGYLSGWRKGEILPLRWEQVDRKAQEVRLSTSKNGEGRVLTLEGNLWELIERRWNARQFQSHGAIGVSDLVFHVKGKRIRDFRKAWATACKAAEIPGRLFHDLRRTAVSNMRRALVPEKEIMAITGHKTRSVFERYNITTGEDMRNAQRRTQAYLETLEKTSNVVSLAERA